MKVKTSQIRVTFPSSIAPHPSTGHFTVDLVKYLCGENDIVKGPLKGPLDT